MWRRQAVGSAESGCRGVVQWWGEGLVGERAAAYEAIEVSSRRFEIHVYDPERTELEVSGVEDEALPDLVGKFDAVEGNTRRALGMLRDRPADHEKAVRDAAGAVDGVGRKGPRRQHYEAVRWGNRPGKSPAASLKALYGYASNTPGARNGRTQIRCSRAKSETCLARRSSSSEFDPCSMSRGHVPATPSTAGSAPPGARLRRR